MSDASLGQFTWYELMTTDPTGAEDFYTKVVGWRAEPWAHSPQPYTMMMQGDAPVAGVMALPDEAAAGGVPPHWTAYVGTPDLDATLAKAKELGASVMWGPMDLDMVGRLAGIADPQGAAICLLQPADPTPDAGAPAAGFFSWHELYTSDWKAAYEFYTNLFGWESAGDFDMGPEMGMYQMFSNGAHPLGGMMNRPAQMPVNAWVYYARVPDLDAAVAAVKANGGQVVLEPMEVPGGDHIAQCLDPQGVMFALHHSDAS